MDPGHTAPGAGSRPSGRTGGGLASLQDGQRGGGSMWDTEPSEAPRTRLILSWASRPWPGGEEPTGHCGRETTRGLAQRCPGGAGLGGRVRARRGPRGSGPAGGGAQKQPLCRPVHSGAPYPLASVLPSAPRAGQIDAQPSPTRPKRRLGGLGCVCLFPRRPGRGRLCNGGYHRTHVTAQTLTPPQERESQRVTSSVTSTTSHLSPHTVPQTRKTKTETPPLQMPPATMF